MTRRPPDGRLQGIDQIIEAWQGWVFPDSKATFVGEYLSGDTVVLELVWNGVQTHDSTVEQAHRNACLSGGGRRRQGEIREHYFDLATMLREIGVFNG